jgi:galactokinase
VLEIADAVGRIAAVVERPAGARWVRAPGRVNLMGDHTDYNDGFVLPLSIQLECIVASHGRDDGRLRMRSLEEGGVAVDLPANGSASPHRVTPAWGRYVAGIARVFAERGLPARGVDAVVSSTVPAGSGLSSSAALEVACALALLAGEDRLSPLDLARACQRAEQLATGVPSGIMDQLSSVAGRRGHALLIDCRSLEVTPAPLPDGIAILVVHSGVPRTLEGSAYAERRAACEALAARLGVSALRDATLEQVADDPFGRHVVTENLRVQETARALEASDRPALAELFAASHASLRDDYRVSLPDLDALVDALTDSGAIGARLTGAGFGGAVVALADTDAVGRVEEQATRRYREATGREPFAFVADAAPGAGSFTPALARRA